MTNIAMILILFAIVLLILLIVFEEFRKPGIGEIAAIRIDQFFNQPNDDIDRQSGKTLLDNSDV